MRNLIPVEISTFTYKQLSFQGAALITFKLIFIFTCNFHMQHLLTQLLKEDQ